MSKPLGIAIAGLGTVGQGVVKAVQEHAKLIQMRIGRDVVIVGVNARNQHKDRGIDISDYRWFDQPLDMVKDDAVDVVVELIGGDSGVAYDLVEAALTHGKHVVTANKALIAHHGKALAELAEQHQVNLRFEAAVAGGIPVIKTVKEGLSGNRIGKIQGILNGTCNYILSDMKTTKRDFGVIVKEAQDKGYAEADPSFDVDGIDAAHKLTILSALSFGIAPDFSSTYVEGISAITPQDMDYAKELGYSIKLLGICCQTKRGIQQRVHPCLVDENHGLASVEGVDNAVGIEGDYIGQLVLQGPGAGEKATASSVMADIIDVAAGRLDLVWNRPVSELDDADILSMQAHQGQYYIRIEVKEGKGILAAVTDELTSCGISVERVLQNPHVDDDLVDIVITTHEVEEDSVAKALEKIEKLGSVQAKPQMIRIE